MGKLGNDGRCKRDDDVRNHSNIVILSIAKNLETMENCQ